MTTIIADDHTIINTQGVRFVEKVDRSYPGTPTTYWLRVTYKGDKMDYQYPTIEARDAQFTALRKAMTAGPIVEHLMGGA